MSGFPAFQSPGFQANAFQAGNNVVAFDYSLGAPAFATPTLKVNYQLSVAAYSLASPAFATPILGTAFLALNPVPLTLGSPSFATPTLRATQRLTVPAYSLGALAFATPPVLTQSHTLFTNAYTLGGLAWGQARVLANRQLVAPAYSVGALSWGTVGPILVNSVILVNAYSLGSPSFGYPRLTWQFVGIEWPLTYAKATGEAAAMLRTFLDTLLSSIPPLPATAERNTVRRLISVLKANADAAIRGDTLGTQLSEIMLAADAAGATFPGVDKARLYLMTQVASKSTFTQIVFRSALTMTLALESKCITRLKFKTQQQCRNLIIYMAKAFDDAKAIGIDEIDVVVYQAMTAMSGALINHLSVTELQLPRLVTYETAWPMPSLYLAHRIYQDVRRSDEIEVENGVVHPAFMPRRLRVLSNAGIPLEQRFLRPRPPAT
jgi:hypothetical protein